MQKELNELVEKLKKAHTDNLISVVLYGSAAEGDHHQKFSDLNVLCVLRSIEPRDLARSEPIFRWWREKDNPAPLLLTEEEVRNSADCFPIEFHDIRAAGRLLHGQDLTSQMAIDDHDYRDEVERELRSKLLRLRQKAAGVLEDRAMLLRLMLDSVSTFTVLMRHALTVAGDGRTTHKREVVARAKEKFGIDATPFEKLIDLREEKIKGGSVEAGKLFKSYLEEIQRVIAVVDGIRRRTA